MHRASRPSPARPGPPPADPNPNPGPGPRPRGLPRRDFLRRSLFGATACATIPSFLHQTLFGLDAHAASAPSTGTDGPIVVIVQLGGGNDSLNTVIPYQNPLYYQARPTLAIPAADVLNLDGQTGLHPALAPLRALWDQGQLAVVNGVGYPNPSLSHFSSTDNWNSGEPGQLGADGWLGRYFDHQCRGSAPTVAYETSDTSTPAFLQAGPGLGVSSANPSRFSWQDPGSSGPAANPADQQLYRRLLAANADWQGTGNAALAYVQRQTHNALVSAGTVQQVLGASGQRGGFPHVAFPKSGLGQQLQTVAGLINGGMPTSIYYVHDGGYDTHQTQVLSANGMVQPTQGAHASLLGNLGASIGAFAAEMQAQGAWNRVVLFTFSEFGRKLIQNGTTGTDHGAAASLFVAGGAIRPGAYGQIPDLATSALVDDHSLVFNVDFRSVYATVLQDWLGVPAGRVAAVLPGGPFPTLGFV